MSKAFDTYKKSIAYSSALSSIYAYLDNANIPYDTKVLLRAEYVLIVSAFDTYFHDCVLKKMIDMFSGAENKSKAFNDFGIPLERVCLLINDNDPISRMEILQNTIREINQKDSYQAPRAIEYALSIMGKTGIWAHLNSQMGTPCEDIKRNLNLIIRRRNQIAHESDINFATEEMNDINRDDVKFAKQYLSQIVDIIDQWI